MRIETMQIETEEVIEFTAKKMCAFIETGFDGTSWRYRFGVIGATEGFAYPYQKHSTAFTSRNKAYQHAVNELLDRLLSEKWEPLVEAIKDAGCPQQINLF